RGRVPGRRRAARAGVSVRQLADHGGRGEGAARARHLAVRGRRPHHSDLDAGRGGAAGRVARARRPARGAAAAEPGSGHAAAAGVCAHWLRGAEPHAAGAQRGRARRVGARGAAARQRAADAGRGAHGGARAVGPRLCACARAAVLGAVCVAAVGVPDGAVRQPRRHAHGHLRRADVGGARQPRARRGQDPHSEALQPGARAERVDAAVLPAVRDREGRRAGRRRGRREAGVVGGLLRRGRVHGPAAGGADEAARRPLALQVPAAAGKRGRGRVRRQRRRRAAGAARRVRRARRQPAPGRRVCGGRARAARALSAAQAVHRGRAQLRRGGRPAGPRAAQPAGPAGRRLFVPERGGAGAGHLQGRPRLSAVLRRVRVLHRQLWAPRAPGRVCAVGDAAARDHVPPPV
ncbi:hypothetical protein H4S02_012615, partial [Coemansia sp. RSA 2611]